MEYIELWLCFVQIVPMDGFKFSDLVDSEIESANENYSGAWGNVIVKANDIGEAFTIIGAGLREKNFKLEFVDKVENIQSLIDEDELDESIVREIDWLLSTEYIFMISDKLFPYIEE